MSKEREEGWRKRRRRERRGKGRWMVVRITYPAQECKKVEVCNLKVSKGEKCFKIDTMEIFFFKGEWVVLLCLRLASCCSVSCTGIYEVQVE